MAAAEAGRRDGAAGMRITIVCQLYPPEVAPIGVMVSELARDLARAGHEVTVVTAFPNHPRGVVFPGFRQRLVRRERAGGITVLRCYMFVTPGRSPAARIAGYLTFGLAAVLAALRLPRQHAVLVPSPPLTNGIVALVLRRLLRTPCVLNIQDVFPDAAIAAGVIRNAALISAIRRMELAIYRGCRRIVVISDGFRQNLEAKGVAGGKIEVIYNWLDTAEITPLSRDNPFARRHALAGKYVVLYSGTIGLISGAELLLDCAQRLSGLPDILLLIVGEGVARDALVRGAGQRGLDNMRFLPFQPRELLSQVQSSADVSVVTLKPAMGRTSVPSKVLGYMAAARPVIASVDRDCDTSRMIALADCGIVTPAGDAPALTAAMLALYRNRVLARRLGANGRAFIERHCSRAAATAAYGRVLREAGCSGYGGWAGGTDDGEHR